MKKYTIHAVYEDNEEGTTYEPITADDLTISEGILHLRLNGEIVFSDAAKDIKSLNSIEVDENGHEKADHSHRHEMTEVGNPTELDKTRYGSDGAEPGEDDVTPDNPEQKLADASGDPDDGATLRDVHHADDEPGRGESELNEASTPSRDGMSEPDADDPATLD